MNPAQFTSLPASACTHDTAHTTFGPDQITKTIYDDAGQVVKVQTPLGVTGQQADEVTSTYTDNGQLETITDANGNKTTYVYDGHDRLSQTQYPSKTVDGQSNPGDYEQLTYDASSNVTAFRNRANQTIAFSYDALGRLTTKNLPGSEPDVSYGYDNLGRLTSASQTGHALSFTYDGLGRQLIQTGPLGTVTSQYDLARNRTRIAHPDGAYWTLGASLFGGDGFRGRGARGKRFRDCRDEFRDGVEAGAGGAEVGGEVERAVDLELDRVDVLRRPAVVAGDVAAGIRRVAGGGVAEAPRGAGRGIHELARRGCAVAVAEHQRGGAGVLGAARRHRMAVEQDRDAESLARLLQRRLQRRVIGAVD